MNPLIMIVLALFLPLFFFALLFGPFYLGMCSSLYFYYDMSNFSEYLFEMDYVMGIHQGFWEFLFDPESSVSFTGFILPVYLPVLIGTALSLYLTYKMVSYIRNIFVLST